MTEIWMIMVVCLVQYCTGAADYPIYEAQRFHNRADCAWYIEAIKPWPNNDQIQIVCVRKP